MKTQVLANDEVVLRFGISEHLALSNSLFLTLMDRGVPHSRLSCGDAYDFAYSVHVAEVAAREAGTPWLPMTDFDDMPSADTPPARISFADDGSEWRLTLEQLWLVESCANQAARFVGAE